MIYKFITTDVVAKIDDDGVSRMSCSIENEEFKAWLAEGNTPEPADPIVPPEITQVTMRQARLALLQENQLDAVEAMITTPEQRIWWDYSTIVEKYNPLCQQISTALNLDLTHLFDLASTL